MHRSKQRSQNEGEEAMGPLEANLLRFLLVLYINFELLESKRKEQSNSRRRQWLATSLTGPSRTKFLAALLLGFVFMAKKPPVCLKMASAPAYCAQLCRGGLKMWLRPHVQRGIGYVEISMWQ